MSDSFETSLRQFLERRDQLSAIEDHALDEIRERIKADLVASLRSGVDAISSLPPGSDAQELRRRAEGAWWSEILQTIGAQQ